MTCRCHGAPPRQHSSIRQPSPQRPLGTALGMTRSRRRDDRPTGPPRQLCADIIFRVGACRQLPRCHGDQVQAERTVRITRHCEDVRSDRHDDPVISDDEFHMTTECAPPSSTPRTKNATPVHSLSARQSYTRRFRPCSPKHEQYATQADHHATMTWPTMTRR